jgi:hypothetical protein
MDMPRTSCLRFRRVFLSTAALIFAGLLVTLPTACTQRDQPGTPGGQAATKIAEHDGTITPAPVEIWQEGKLIHTLAWDELKTLPTQSFNTGMEDAQTGYLFVDALRQVGITEAKSVTLYGRGLNEPVRLGWKAIENPTNQILIGLTHKGTIKIVAGNFESLNRDRWVRHLYKIEIHTQSAGKDRADKKIRKGKR